MQKASKEAMRIANQVWDKVFGHVYDIESMDYRRKRQGIRYKVKHKGDNTWSCSCMSWKTKTGVRRVQDLDTNKIHERTCKHIRFCMKEEGMKIKVFRY